MKFSAHLAPWVCVCLVAQLFTTFASADTEVPFADLPLMERVANWQLDHPSSHPGTSWTQAPFYAGVMALAKLSGNTRYVDAMRAVGEKNQWKLGERVYHADYYAVAQMYLEMYLLKREPQMIAETQTRFDYILAHPKDNNLTFDRKKNPDYLDRWSWCDSLFMGPPAWARLAAATGKPEYLAFAIDRWRVTSDYLFDKTEHLYFRDDTFFDKREANGCKTFWSRGNGWVMAGLVRFLQYLPKENPQRDFFVSQFKEMAERLITLQQSDGLWRSSLLDPEHYPLKETSGTAFYAYAFAWGVNEGLLDPTRFKPAAVHAWEGLKQCVDSDGKLTHVQPIGADPKRFPDDSTEVYGVGGFLLAGTEIARLK